MKMEYSSTLAHSAFWLVLLIGIEHSCLGALRVLTPLDLVNKFDNGEIEGSYANFGKIPYGSLLAGRVFYDANNPTGCDRFQGSLEREGDPDTDFSPIVLVDRGNCSFVKKARNVQEHGGALVLVANNKNEDPSRIIMIDDGTGTQIVIPTILIGKESGKKLREGIEHSERIRLPFDLREFVTILVDFTMPNPDDRVEYDIYYNSGERNAMEFITNMSRYATRLKSHALMTPHLVTWICRDPRCRHAGLRCPEISGEIFCVPPQNDMFDSTPGKEILMSGVIEKCIYNRFANENNAEKWWLYMKGLHQECPGQIPDRSCQKKAMALSKISEDNIANCTFNPRKILEEEYETLKMSGVPYHPAVVINQRVYRGALVPGQVFESICAGFNATPSVCSPDYDESSGMVTSRSGMSTWKVVIIVVICVAIFNIGIICLYRKYAKKEMQDEMNTQISQIMSQYKYMPAGKGPDDSRQIGILMTPPPSVNKTPEEKK